MKILDRIAKDPVEYAIRILIILAVVGLLLLTTGCATMTEGPQDDGSFVYRLSPEQVKQCEAEGGCSTVTGLYERQLIQEAARYFCGKDI